MVLDASAIVAVFDQEPGYEALEKKIDEADVILIGAPTLLETVLVLTNKSGRDQRSVLEKYLRRIDATIVDFSSEHFLIAADAFIRFGRGRNSKAKLNFGDCLAYAVAAMAKDKLLFVGQDFVHTDILAA